MICEQDYWNTFEIRKKVRSTNE